jgi:hypothetical protein
MSLSGLFAAALLGALVVVGLALSALGWLAVVPYVTLLVTGLVIARRRRPRVDEGRTCTCCTSTVYDEVEVR